jgi:Tol biopolymer transport system component/imidazolonepropionase-like amidohydrolase
MRWARKVRNQWIVLTIVAAGGAALVGAYRLSPPPSDTTSATITTGTSFSFAASPQSRLIVMDLLGALWAIPAEGGAATKITEELIEARLPSLRSDGSAIVFQGFKDNGGWDLWSIKPDGSEAKRLTTGPFDDVEAQWSHDGTKVAFSSDRNGSFDVWVLDVASGRLQAVTKDSAQDYAPAWSPDDSELAFVRQQAPPPGGATPAGPAVAIVSVNLKSGSERELATVDGRVGPLSWTPDGKGVIYNVVAEGSSRLEILGQSVVSGEDVFPARVQWLSAQDFLYAADGKIKRRTLGGTGAQTVEFTVRIPLSPTKYAYKKYHFDGKTPRNVQGIVRPTISPDGRHVAFAAVGDVWLMEVGAKPRRVTNDSYVDTDPAWSPDGTQLVFSSDRAEVGNLDLWVRDIRSGSDRRLTRTPHADFGANWSPDGTRLAFLSMLPHQQGAAVCVIDLRTGNIAELWRSAQRISSYPTWSSDGRTLFVSAFDQYSSRFREGIWKPLLIPVDGGQPRWVDITPNVSLTNGVDEGPVWSPDGTMLALAHEGLLKVIAVEKGEPTNHFRQLTNEPINSPSWTADSKKILFLATDRLKLLALDNGQAVDVPLDLTYESKIPSGSVVVHAARVWTGRAAGLRTDVDLVVQGNRIQSIQPHNAQLHAANRVVDASNQTVIPGLIDTHGHVYREYGEAAGRLWLSYGVTTVRDPVGMGYRCLELKEASEAGVRMAPRYFFSYAALDGARGAFAEMYSIYSMERLERELQRAKRLDFDLFKMYVRLPLAMRKRVIEFAHREMGVPVTSHFIYPESTWSVDGTEHTGGRVSALGNVYDDMLQLFMKSGIQWCPTIVVSGGYDLVASDDPSYLDDVRLKTLSPDWALEPSRQRLQRVSKSALAARARALGNTGKALIALTRGGVPILTGTDVPNMPTGAGLQAELELFVRAGLTPEEALRAATVNSAAALGLEAELGTLEPGKLADMVIVEGNPLENIKNAARVQTVIKNGVVFDLKTLLSGRAPTATSNQD